MNKLTAVVLAVTTISSFVVSPAFAESQCLRLCKYERSTPEHCGDQLGHLKRVFPSEVLGVDDRNRVWVTEFCLSSELMRSDGNAAYLRTSIADNDVLVEMLARKGYHPEDVYAVKMMGDDTINLFVHPFATGSGGQKLSLIAQ